MSGTCVRVSRIRMGETVGQVRVSELEIRMIAEGACVSELAYTEHSVCSRASKARLGDHETPPPHPFAIVIAECTSCDLERNLRYELILRTGRRVGVGRRKGEGYAVGRGHWRQDCYTKQRLRQGPLHFIIEKRPHPATPPQ